jgi:hypothetical protein
MARYARADATERRTAFIGIQLTPSERDELDAAATKQGATVSAYTRECLFRRSAAIVAATRRNPEAAALMRELSAIGNNLNQIARQLNTTGEMRDPAMLDAALELLKPAMSRVLDL